MNILGEGFPDEIIKQVEVRQKVYGSGYNSLNPRTSEEILYLNANTSWVKLVSSVDIDDPSIPKEPRILAPPKGSKGVDTSPEITLINNQLSQNEQNVNVIPYGPSLAKKFVLFNGTDNVDEKLRSGIALNGDLLGNNNAYGIGGTEFGIRPMMGIISADIKHENRGSIRRATIKVKAFNKAQFDIIDVLYLRLGFSVLLEWGHSMYFDNKGILQTDNDNSLASDFLLQKNLHPPSIALGVSPTMDNYVDFLELIKYQKIASFGNYDAMFGKVCNFHWSFMQDGSYDITIDLVSIGDIVESFNMNVLISGIDTSIKVDKTNNKDPLQMTSQDVITNYANKSEIGKYFWKLTGPKTFNDGEDGEQAASIGGIGISSDFLRSDEENQVIKEKQEKQARNKTINKDKLDITYDGKGIIHYIRLGAFLQFIKEDMMYYFTTSNSKKEALGFDYDVLSNLMYIESMQVSTDPEICVINREILIGDNKYKFAESGEEFESPLFNNRNDNPYGQIMNIYVSMKFILIKLDELKNTNTNKVILIDFLNIILSAINGALGGISKLETTIDETSNKIIIRDGNPLPDIKNVIDKLNSINIYTTIPDKYATFDLYGYLDSSAGFIKDFSFTTEIAPELSTMLTIGATANSTVVGENSTAFSRLNRGLTDRFKEKVEYLQLSENERLIEAINNLEDNENTQYLQQKLEQQLYKNIYEKYAYTYINYLNYIKQLSEKKYSGEANTYKDALSNCITYLQQARETQLNYLSMRYPSLYLNSSPAVSTGFIPFNMSLTMDGLSGMKIYSKFNIDTRYLPTNYPKTCDFLIKNINHTISNNKWFTKIESVVISQQGK
jgi:hypothetical protein